MKLYKNGLKVICKKKKIIKMLPLQVLGSGALYIQVKLSAFGNTLMYKTDNKC